MPPGIKNKEYKFRMKEEFRSFGVFAAFSRWSLDISSKDSTDSDTGSHLTIV